MFFENVVTIAKFLLLFNFKGAKMKFFQKIEYDDDVNEFIITSLKLKIKITVK